MAGWQFQEPYCGSSREVKPSVHFQPHRYYLGSQHRDWGVEVACRLRHYLISPYCIKSNQINVNVVVQSLPSSSVSLWKMYFRWLKNCFFTSSEFLVFTHLYVADDIEIFEKKYLVSILYWHLTYTWLGF